MTSFACWSIFVVSGALSLSFFGLWRRAKHSLRAREELWRSTMTLLQNGQYSEAQTLVKNRQSRLPQGATEEIGLALGAVARDVKQHETARRELEDVLSSLQDAVLVVDAEAHLRFLNAPALQLFGVQIQDVLGAQLLEALPSFGLDSCVRVALQEGRSTTREQSLYFTGATHPPRSRRSQIAENPIQNDDFDDDRNPSSTRLLASNGTTSPETTSQATNANATANAASGASAGLFGANEARREILMRVSPVRSSLGRVAGAVAILQDLTEMRRLERVRRDFVANASHELRTPIANIRAGAETILSDPDDRELARRFLPQIVTESERLSRLVSDLLDLAHADAAPETPRTPVDFCAVADAVVERLQEKAMQNNVEVRRNYECDDGVACVAGDFASLEQIVFNLLDNALIYTPSGGKVELSIHISEIPHEVLFSISDTGIGIPGEDQERVFERFYRVDKARSRAQGGTGLGLAIVKHIVENHNGSIAVQSAIDHGTIFVVRLPAL